jgi:hypothetical protein
MVKPRPSDGATTTSPRRPRPPQNASGGAVTLRRQSRANTRLVYDVLGVALVAVGLVLLATLAWPQRDGENVFGRAVVGGLRLLVGAGAWVFPFVLFACGGLLAVGRNRSLDNVGGAMTLFLIFVTWWHLGHVGPVGQFAPDNLLAYGGWAGATLSFVLRKVVGTAGGHIVLFALSLVGTVWLLDKPLPSLLNPCCGCCVRAHEKHPRCRDQRPGSQRKGSGPPPRTTRPAGACPRAPQRGLAGRAGSLDAHAVPPSCSRAEG